jgi:hypothetical protein
MNERIRELAFQAMSINQKVSDDSFFVEVSKLKEFEKFAELIVGECIEIVEPCKCGCRCGQEVAITDSIIADIKEHFGVEE